MNHTWVYRGRTRWPLPVYPGNHLRLQHGLHYCSRKWQELRTLPQRKSKAFRVFYASRFSAFIRSIYTFLRLFSLLRSVVLSIDVVIWPISTLQLNIFVAILTLFCDGIESRIEHHYGLYVCFSLNTCILAVATMRERAKLWHSSRRGC